MAASASQRSLIAYLNECAEEWDICHNPRVWSGGFCISMGIMLARSLVQLKVIRVVHVIMSGDDANVWLIRNCHILLRNLSSNS